MSGRITLNVDVDNTLTNGVMFWDAEPKPNEIVCDYIRKLYFTGKYTIIIWTARLWCNAPELIGWLEKYSVPFHGIKMNKGASDIYIDDKAQLPTEENLKNLLDNEIKVPVW